MDLDFQTLFKELNSLGIDYLVVGGLAVNFHGIPRMTYDVDLMMLLQPDNILKLINRLNEWGYRPRVPIDPKDLANEEKREMWIRDKGMKALNFYGENLPIGEIDLIFDSPISYDDLKSKRVEIEVEGERIPTVSINDLIRLKLYAGRKQDLSDVEHLKMILEK